MSYYTLSIYTSGGEDRWWFTKGSKKGRWFLFTGGNTFVEDMRAILGYDMGWYWRISWSFCSPLMILFIFVFFAISYGPLTYQEYTYPPGLEVLGWCMCLASVMVIPGYMVYFLIVKAEGKSLAEVNKKLSMQAIIKLL